jgi:alanine-glyoxylate transaminase/serine-glyoxylate transaminase/serine-pyruvate transaminase
MPSTMPPTVAIEPRLLLGPGPSPVHERILEALARPTVGHLDPQFLRIMDEVNAGLRRAFGTKNPMTFPVSGTGSAAMEAALANVIEPGDTVIVGVNGVFGGRLVEMARRMGAEVVVIEAEWGRIVPPEALIDALHSHPGARALAVVQAETSTGARQPLDEIGAAVRRTDTLLIVDSVTALAGIPVEVDRVGIDVCYSGTQKCLGVPPGLGPITFSPRAMERITSRPVPCQSWYLDVNLIAAYLGEERRYHHTAPINMVYALHEGLAMVQEEGLEARWRRHADVGAALQKALVERGFELFAQEGFRLPQLTAARLPGARDEGPLRAALLVRYGIEVGGGLGPAKGKIWRVGLMGSGATMENVERLLEAVDELIPRA